MNLLYEYMNKPKECFKRHNNLIFSHILMLVKIKLVENDELVKIMLVNNW